MSVEFSPEKHYVVHPETGERGFSDAWGLTAAQMGSTLAALEKVQSDVMFRKEDLVGYHRLQYGMDEDVISETVDVLAKGSHWGNWEPAALGLRLVPSVLGERTAPARMERIILNHYSTDPLPHMTGDLKALTEVKEVPPEDGSLEVRALVPKSDVLMHYLGRMTTVLENATVGQLISDHKFHTDMIRLERDGEQGVSTQLLAVSTTEGDRGFVVPPRHVLAARLF